jgi:hypothetical protein
MSDGALSIVLGVALAAATGFRVFLPMLIVSGAAYTGHLHLDDGFACLGTPSALIMLSVAAVAEVLAYYIPVVDNLLDVVSAPAAFIAGTILSAAVMTDMPPMVKWTAAVIAGGGVAGLTRGLTGVLRAHSTVLTGGLGNFVISTGELGGAALISFLALAAPIAAIRAGRAVPVRGDAIAPPAASRRQTIERSDVGDSRGLPCPRGTPEIRTRRKPSRLIIRNPVRPPPQILGFLVANPLVTRDFFLRFAGCGKQNLGFPANPSYTFADRGPCVSPSVRRREVSMENKRAERSERPAAQSPRRGEIFYSNRL